MVSNRRGENSDHKLSSSFLKSDAQLESKILELFYSKAPNGLSFDWLVYELAPSGYSRNDISQVLEHLCEKETLFHALDPVTQTRVSSEYSDRRHPYYLKSIPQEFPLVDELRIGNRTLPRMMDGTVASAEDINNLLEAMVEYTNGVSSKIEERVKEETGKIYRQMIGIFGVFVSIFAIIVISTDKMLRFSPDVLYQDWMDLFIKSAALFLPVGIVIALLVWVTMWGFKK